MHHQKPTVLGVLCAHHLFNGSWVVPVVGGFSLQDIQSRLKHTQWEQLQEIINWVRPSLEEIHAVACSEISELRLVEHG